MLVYKRINIPEHVTVLMPKALFNLGVKELAAFYTHMKLGH